MTDICIVHYVNFVPSILEICFIEKALVVTFFVCLTLTGCHWNRYASAKTCSYYTVQFCWQQILYFSAIHTAEFCSYCKWSILWQI